MNQIGEAHKICSRQAVQSWYFSVMPHMLVAFQDFTFDPSSGDLTRKGKRQRIPQQTSRLLSILVERAGTVVTREELQQSLWPDGEFLDHDHAINRVINHLRYVLHDNTRNPRFIETVPKRGYRFLVSVSMVAVESRLTALEADASSAPALPVSSAPEQTEASHAIVPLEPEILVGPQQVQAATPVRGSRTHLYIWLLAGTALVVIAAAGFFWQRHRAEPQRVRLGIAPFLASGPGAEQLGESFRLDLADSLSQLPVVEIRATNSLSNMGRDDASIRNVSETLHLDMVLFGKFTVENNLCIVQFELVRSKDAVHLASFQYRGTREELSVIRDKLQRDVFLSLEGKEKSIQAIRGSTENPQAYSDYLQGREQAQLHSPAGLEGAIAHYRSAIGRDPNFAQAYAAMATANLGLRYYANPLEHQRLAEQLARQALSLDSSLAEAHAVLGDVAFRQDWDFPRGESEIRRALELEPHEAAYHAWLAGLLADVGRFSEAMREMDTAIADEPLWTSVYSMDAYVAGVAHNNARMIGAVQKYAQLAPDSAWSHNQMAWAFFAAKRYDEALAEWRRMAEIDHDTARLALENRGLEAYRKGGIAAYAALRLDAIEHGTVDLTRHANDFEPAEWYAFTGHREQAIAALSHMVKEHDGEAVTLAVNPMFDSLHGDPQFLGLLHQVGLELPAGSAPAEGGSYR